MTTRVLGVRHHSPACARRVRRVIDEMNPRWILIEGPADMNGRLGELGLDHTLPIAAFAFYFDDDRRYAAYYPFCVHSPEWVALRLGLERGAEVRFIDLPGFAVEEQTLAENRYADRVSSADYVERLEQAFGERGYDAIWDAAFELAKDEEVDARLDTFFDGIRDVEPAHPSDHQREAFMADYVAWASKQGGDVLVVCGGFHASVLASAVDRDVPEEPAPPPPSPDSRAETWLVPFSEHRLDSFAGYASGLPSPAWYRWGWSGASPARTALKTAARRLRKRGINVSPADTIAAYTQAEILARVRGHASIARVDLLDAVASTWVKEALDAPLPWSMRQALAPGTHPVVVELIAALSGDKRGRLASATPLPPLVQHVEALLDEHDLRVTGDSPARELSLYPGETETEPRRIVLERLLLVGIAGFRRRSDPETAPQVYALFTDDEFAGSLAEAGSYGPTLEAAAIATLEERAGDLSNVETVTALLATAVRARLPSLSSRALAALCTFIEKERHLEVIGVGLRRLLSLLRHAGMTPEDRAAVISVMGAAVERGLWLVEGIRGGGVLSLGRVAAVAALRDAVLNEREAVGVPLSRVSAVWCRIARATDPPADLRGAALGAAVSHGFIAAKDAADLAVTAFERASPTELGDFLTGLLTLAREVLGADESVVAGLDEALKRLDSTDFMVALPSLRLAFGRLPARERAAFAQRVVALHGGTVTALLARHDVPPEDVARAQKLEAQVEATLAEVGLDG